MESKRIRWKCSSDESRHHEPGELIFETDKFRIYVCIGCGCLVARPILICPHGGCWYETDGKCKCDRVTNLSAEHPDFPDICPIGNKRNKDEDR